MTRTPARERLAANVPPTPRPPTPSVSTADSRSPPKSPPPSAHSLPRSVVPVAYPFRLLHPSTPTIPVPSSSESSVSKMRTNALPRTRRRTRKRKFCVRAVNALTHLQDEICRRMGLRCKKSSCHWFSVAHSVQCTTPECGYIYYTKRLGTAPDPLTRIEETIVATHIIASSSTMPTLVRMHLYC